MHVPAARRPCAVLLLAVLGALPGCAVGPDFHQPAASSDQNYTATPVPSKTVSADTSGGDTQVLDPAGAVRADWWTLFRCDPLTALVAHGLENSPSVHAAAHTLRAAQATYDAQTASLFFPQADLQLGASRQRVSGAQLGEAGLPPFTYNLFNASVGVSYRADVFGGSRRTVEGYAAQVDYERYELEAAYLALSSNVVTTALAEASYRGQLDSLREVLAAQRSTLAIVERQFAAGASSKADLLAQRTQVAATEAEVPPLEKALAQTRHRLAVLVGDAPNRPDLPEFDLAAFTLPVELPVSLPSELVRDRPDIQAAEAQLHAASAQVGVATANLYPQINLTASTGFAAATTGDLLKSSSAVWSLAGGVAQPLFHAGALRAQKRAAEARYDAALDAYQATVLAAFEQVADTLRAIEWDAKALASAATADASAHESLELATRQYAAGGISFVSLLAAQRAYYGTHRGLVQAQALRYADTAALYAALGGGWWNRPQAGR